jgi:hypothetical protein
MDRADDLRATADGHGQLKRAKDRRAGLFVAGVGVFAIVVGSRYGVGSLARVGPGLFPSLLGTVLLLLGMAIFLTAGRGGEPALVPTMHDGSDHPFDLRGWIAIVLGVVWFIAVTPLLGLVPGTFGCVFVSALGDRSATAVKSAVLAAVVSILGAVIFGWALRVGVPYFGS